MNLFINYFKFLPQIWTSSSEADAESTNPPETAKRAELGAAKLSEHHQGLPNMEGQLNIEGYPHRHGCIVGRDNVGGAVHCREA